MGAVGAAIVFSVVKRLKRFLRESSHFHVKQDEIHSLADIVDLIDRFIDGRLKYGLEWDDFISWESESSEVEAIREEIADLEPFFFSPSASDKAEGRVRLVSIRDRVAVGLGLPTRSD